MRDMSFSGGIEYVKALKGRAPDLMRETLKLAPRSSRKSRKRYDRHYHDIAFPRPAGRFFLSRSPSKAP